MLFDDLRPLIYQHMVVLTAAAFSPEKALAIAAHVAVIMQDDSQIVAAIKNAARAAGLQGFQVATIDP